MVPCKHSGPELSVDFLILGQCIAYIITHIHTNNNIYRVKAHGGSLDLQIL